MKKASFILFTFLVASLLHSKEYRSRDSLDLLRINGFFPHDVAKTTKQGSCQSEATISSCLSQLKFDLRSSLQKLSLDPSFKSKLYALKRLTSSRKSRAAQNLSSYVDHYLAFIEGRFFLQASKSKKDRYHRLLNLMGHKSLTKSTISKKDFSSLVQATKGTPMQTQVYIYLVALKKLEKKETSLHKVLLAKLASLARRLHASQKNILESTVHIFESKFRDKNWKSFPLYKAYSSFPKLASYLRLEKAKAKFKYHFKPLAYFSLEKDTSKLRAAYAAMERQPDKFSFTNKLKSIDMLLSKFTANDRSYYEPYMEKKAALYIQDKKLESAAEIYIELAKKNEGRKKDKFEARALSLYSQDANWPTYINKELPKNYSRNKLPKLISIFESKANKNWHRGSQLGWLYLITKRSAKAFGIWAELLENNKVSITKESTFALSYMVKSLSRRKRWKNLDKILTLVENRKIRLEFPVNQMHKQAIYAFTKQSYAAKNYKDSLTYANRFVAKYPKDKKRTEIHYLKADSQKNLGIFADAKNSFEIVFKLDTKSSYAEPSLKEAGLLAEAMAIEDEAIRIHQLYLRYFNEETYSNKLRSKLIQLLMGKEFYVGAIKELKSKLQDKTLDRAKRIESGRKALNLEAQYGSFSGVKNISSVIKTELSPMPEYLLADVLSAEAKFILSSGDEKKYLELKNKLQPFRNQFQKIKLLLDEIQLVLAETQLQTFDKEILSISLKNPAGKISEIYRDFLKVKDIDDRLCGYEGAAYCPLAKLQLHRASLRAREQMEQVNIDPNLDETLVNKFQNKKDQHMTYLLAEADQSKRMAFAFAGSTLLKPRVAEELLSELFQDANTMLRPSSVRPYFFELQAGSKK